MRVLLRAIVNLDPYTFADDLAEETTGENERRSAEEVLLATIDATADDKPTRFAIRLALSGHVGIPRENELDFLTEADTVFTPPLPRKAKTPKKQKRPTPINPDAPTTTLKKRAARKKIAAYPAGGWRRPRFLTHSRKELPMKHAAAISAVYAPSLNTAAVRPPTPPTTHPEMIAQMSMLPSTCMKLGPTAALLQRLTVGTPRPHS